MYDRVRLAFCHLFFCEEGNQYGVDATQWMVAIVALMYAEWGRQMPATIMRHLMMFLYYFMASFMTGM